MKRREFIKSIAGLVFFFHCSANASQEQTLAHWYFGNGARDIELG